MPKAASLNHSREAPLTRTGMLESDTQWVASPIDDHSETGTLMSLQPKPDPITVTDVAPVEGLFTIFVDDTRAALYDTLRVTELRPDVAMDSVSWCPDADRDGTRPCMLVAEIQAVPSHPDTPKRDDTVLCQCGVMTPARVTDCAPVAAVLHGTERSNAPE